MSLTSPLSHPPKWDTLVLVRSLTKGERKEADSRSRDDMPIALAKVNRLFDARISCSLGSNKPNRGYKPGEILFGSQSNMQSQALTHSGQRLVVFPAELLARHRRDVRLHLALSTMVHPEKDQYCSQMKIMLDLLDCHTNEMRTCIELHVRFRYLRFGIQLGKIKNQVNITG